MARLRTTLLNNHGPYAQDSPGVIAKAPKYPNLDCKLFDHLSHRRYREYDSLRPFFLETKSIYSFFSLGLHHWSWS